jgi:hypothetical protein
MFSYKVDLFILKNGVFAIQRRFKNLLKRRRCIEDILDKKIGIIEYYELAANKIRYPYIYLSNCLF